MGCFSGRVKLDGCTTWADLSEKCKVYDDNVKKELDILNAKKVEDRTPQEKDHLAFYGALAAWNPDSVKGKAFDAKVCIAADKVYAHLDGDKGSSEKTKLEEDLVELSKEVGKLKPEEKAK